MKQTETIDVRRVQWFDSRFYRIQTKAEAVPIFVEAVTHVLGHSSPKPWLRQAYGRHGEIEMQRRLEEGQDKGRHVHHGAYTVAAGGVVLYQPQWMETFTPEEVADLRKARDIPGPTLVIEDQEWYWQIMKFKALLEILKPQILVVEHEMGSVRLSLGGTLDIGAYLKAGVYAIATNGADQLVIPKDGFAILDIKSGRYDDDALLQISAYRRLWEEDQENPRVDYGIVVHTNAGTSKGSIEGLQLHARSAKEMDQDWTDFEHLHATYRRTGITRPIVRDMPVVLALDKEVAQVVAPKSLADYLMPFQTPNVLPPKEDTHHDNRQPQTVQPGRGDSKRAGGPKQHRAGRARKASRKAGRKSKRDRDQRRAVAGRRHRPGKSA